LLQIHHKKIRPATEIKGLRALPEEAEIAACVLATLFQGSSLKALFFRDHPILISVISEDQW